LKRFYRRTSTVTEDVTTRDPGAATRDRDDALLALRSVVFAADQYRQALINFLGVGNTEAQAVSHLNAHGELGQSELARLLGITTGATTSLIDRLEVAGLAERSPHATDRRRSVVRLSEKGRDLVAAGRDSVSGIFNGFADAELDHVVGTLETIAEGLKLETANLGWPVGGDQS
jgi:DNA-binding MarR family transcriptional regulator